MRRRSTSTMMLALLLAVPAVAFAATYATERSGSSTSHMTKERALTEIQTDGYTNVQDLRHEKGGWTAKAMESGKPVSLLFDGTTVRKE